MTGALDAVIDAALERALVDADEARRYFALAGALDRGAARTDGVEPSQRQQRTPGREPPTRSEQPTGALGAALLSTAAVGALQSTGADDIDSGAWSPGGQAVEPHAELVAAGAAAACRRLDVESATVAARSGVSPERLARRVDSDATAGSK